MQTTVYLANIQCKFIVRVRSRVDL